MIYFIGAGPGDPNLVTVKAQKILQIADAVLFTGSLVPKEVLSWCKNDAIIEDSQGMKYPESAGDGFPHIHHWLDWHRQIQCGLPSAG